MEKRDKQFKVNVNLKEYNIIYDKSRQTRMSSSAFLRNLGLNKEVKQPLSNSQIEQIKQLIKLGNNLNQLNKVAHSQGIISVVNETSNLIESIQKFIDEIRRPN